MTLPPRQDHTTPGLRTDSWGGGGLGDVFVRILTPPGAGRTAGASGQAFISIRAAAALQGWTADWLDIDPRLIPQSGGLDGKREGKRDGNQGGSRDENRDDDRDDKQDGDQGSTQDRNRDSHWDSWEGTRTTALGQPLG